MADQLLPEIVDPITGEVIDRSSADRLIEAYARIDARDKELFAAKNAIRQALGDLTTGDAKTRRVRGQVCLAKIEMPDDRFDQSILREAWNSYPELREIVLKIGTIDVRMREYKKLETESGPPAFEQFKRMILSANKGPSGLPRVTVEVGASTKEPAESTGELQEPVEESLW